MKAEDKYSGTYALRSLYIKFIAGVEISYLDTKHQILLNDVIEYNCCEVNAKQGTQIKKHYLEGDLSEDKINEILNGEEIKEKPEKISINYTRLRKYFPKVEDFIKAFYKGGI